MLDDNPRLVEFTGLIATVDEFENLVCVDPPPSTPAPTPPPSNSPAPSTAPSTVCPLIDNVVDNLNGFQDLDFQSTPFPTQENAGAFGPNDVGAIYRHVGVATGIDALVELTALDAQSVNSLTTFPVGPRPMLGGFILDNEGGFFEWEVTLVDTGTTDPITPVNLAITAFDIDGFVTDPDQNDFVTFFDHDGYYFNDPTFLNVTESGADVTFMNGIPENADTPADQPEWAA